MASVWYLGRSNTRSISATEWAAAGISDAANTVWNAANGYSIPADQFTAAQLEILEAETGFDTDAPDGPRTSPVITPEDKVTMADVVELLNDSGLSAAALSATYGPKSLETSKLDADHLGHIPTQLQRRDFFGAQVTAAGKVPTGQSSNGSGTGYTYRASYKAAVACTDLRIHLLGWFADWTGELPLDNTITYKVSIEYNGSIYPLTFGPTRTTTIDPWCSIASDPLALTLAKGDVFAVRVHMNTPASGKYLSGVAGGSPNFTNGTDGFSTGDFADVTTTVTNSGLSPLFAPVAITGTVLQARTPQLAAITDSIGNGEGDGQKGGTNFGIGGWLVRAVNEQVPMIRSSAGADRLSGWKAKSERRRALLNGSTHALISIGTNDLAAGSSLAQTQADMLWLATEMQKRGMKVIVSTVLPRTTSTDGWRSTAGQTVHAMEPTRVQYNDWLRAGAPIHATTKAAVAVGTAGALLAGDAGHPLVKHDGANAIDLADKIETARNSGIWQASSRTVSDAAITTGTATLTSATAAFTSADVDKGISIAGAGAAGGSLNTYIRSYTNATTVVLGTNAGTTVTGASASIDTWTYDGIHPHKRGHLNMATAFDATKLAL